LHARAFIVLKFVSSYLALSYLAFATIGVIGVLQILAAWRPYAGLALLDYRQKRGWQRAVGPLLIVAAYAWFFGTRREILTPGPAGVELTLLFAGGVILALALTLLGAGVLGPYRKGESRASLPAGAQVSSVQIDHGWQGLVFTGTASREPGPGICLIPDPARPVTQLYPLTGALARAGLTVLAPIWEVSVQRYPDALALVSAAMAFLARHPLVAPDRLAIGGVGVGGDLALRAAATDRQIRAVIALAPLLAEQNAVAGLGSLREMTYTQAAAWGLKGRRRDLVCHLEAVEATRQGARQPAMALYGSQDAIVSVARAREALARVGVSVYTVRGEGHLSLPASPQVVAMICQWLRESLNES
jgi:hypothetical protein